MSLLARQLAPAKINLSLHVTGKRQDGYHLLDSLVCFADIGDEITLSPASSYKLNIQGPFSAALHNEDNLVSRAVRMLENLTQRRADIRVTLTKNLPVGSGIGGGSTDAAVVIKALLHHWKMPLPFEELLSPLTKLGADVPVCYIAKPSHLIGIGDSFAPTAPLPRLPLLLVNPLIPCPTKDVFGKLAVREKEVIPLPSSLDAASLFAYLDQTGNDMLEAACRIVPPIQEVLRDIQRLEGVKCARMSGSGATCFGLFDDEAACAQAALTLKQNRPDWWVRAGHLLSS